MRIGARGSFCAGHQLPQHSQIHGHSYEVTVYIATGCAEELQQAVRLACAKLDHRMLNDILPEPTMEAIARFVVVEIPTAQRVVVARPVEGLFCEWP